MPETDMLTKAYEGAKVSISRETDLQKAELFGEIVLSMDTGGEFVLRANLKRALAIRLAQELLIASMKADMGVPPAEDEPSA